MKMLFYILPVLIGVVMTIQSGVNAQLRAAIQNPLLAAFISFAGGVLSLGIILLVTRQPLPEAAQWAGVNWYKFTGGMLGAFVVTSVIFTVHRIGAANMFVLIVAGQLITAVLMDHFGVLGMKVNTISLTKLLGILLVIAGAWLVNKK